MTRLFFHYFADSAEQDKLQLDVIIKTPSNLRDSWYCAELFENYLELSEGFNPESTVCTHLTVSFSNECQVRICSTLRNARVLVKTNPYFSFNYRVLRVTLCYIVSKQVAHFFTTS